MRRFIGVAVFLCATGSLAADALRQAAEALTRNDYAAAIPHLESALESDPDNTNARFNLAYAFQSIGDDGSAIQHYRLVSAQQPDLLPARQNLAALLMRSGQFADAAQEYGAIAEARPGDPQILSMLATAHREADDPAAAARAYGRMLELDRNSLDTLLGLAQALDAAGHLHEAVPYYLRAAGIDSKLEDLLPGIAERLEDAAHKQDSLELYRRYARSRRDDAAVQEDIGILLLEDGNFRSAALALERAVAIEPTSQRHAALAEAYRRAGTAEAAHDQLRLAAESAPGDSGIRVRYANALLQRREFEHAAREYLAACEADAGHRDAWNGLAFAMFQLGNFPASLRAIQESERLGPPQAASVYLKALGLDKLQQYEQAQTAYGTFLAMKPDMQDEVWKAEQRLKTIEKVLAKR